MNNNFFKNKIKGFNRFRLQWQCTLFISSSCSSTVDLGKSRATV